VARRFAIARQRLSGRAATGDADAVLDTVRALGCLQLDPISVVARSHELVLWSRLGAYDPADLDRALWSERTLFEYWAHCASIVLTEEYPVYSVGMREHGNGKGAYQTRLRAWVEENDALRRRILLELERDGPLPSRSIEDEAVSGWRSGGWNGGRNVGRMLDYLWFRGEIMVAGRAGGQKLWDLSERVLPPWTPREELGEREVVRRAAQTSLRALGVATAAHITRHYTRGRYPGLKDTLAELEAERRIARVEVRDEGMRWPGTWWVHTDDVTELDRIAFGQWTPRTALLSPFDNLICDRARTEAMWSFRYRIEIYVPKRLREYGYYVLPILHGDRLIGRVDPTMDRGRGVLRLNAMYAEPDAPMTAEASRAVAGAVHDLAARLGARQIECADPAPQEWKRALA
jgi:uncharacterized protein YcaQ